MSDWQDVAVPDRVLDWVRQILAPRGDPKTSLDLHTQTDTIGDPLVVDFTAAAMASSRRFELEMLALADHLEADGLGDMPIRAREIAMRLSLVCALADTPDTPIVTVDCFDWSAAYIRFFLMQTIDALKHRVADTATERTRNTILTAIRDAGTRGVTNRELHRGKAFIGLPRRDRVEAIESLLVAELVVWTDVPTEKAGRPRKALIAIGDAVEAEAGANSGTMLQSDANEHVSA
jgi:hypothetical protein